MAGHLPINDKYVGESESETQAIRGIVEEVRNDLREVRESWDMSVFDDKYKRLPDDFCDKGETEVYSKPVDVPETMVWGGRALVEVHLRGTRLSKIFLVA